MKIVYVVQNPGIASRTPEGWESAIVTPTPDGTYTPQDWDAIETADVLVAGLIPISGELLSRAKNLKLVQRLGVGYDNVDLVSAARLGVPVCNMADFNADTVAEHTLMMILALLRRVFESTLLMKAGRWPTQEVIGGGNYDLKGKTLGLVGLGAIGAAVARKVAGFEVRTIYFDARPRPALEERAVGVTFAPLASLLRESDIVSLHVPHTIATHRLIGSAELAMMKRTAFLINTARGTIIDSEALATALRGGKLAGAGLDVFEDEPLPARHPLRSCPNILLTPHTGGQTREAMERMVTMLRENLDRVSTSRALRNLVSTP